jgi:hypothetical protein
LYLTVSLWPVLEAERERHLGVVLEKFCGERVPPEVVALVRPLLKPLVHLVDAVVGLGNGRRRRRRRRRAEVMRMTRMVVGVAVGEAVRTGRTAAEMKETGRERKDESQ